MPLAINIQERPGFIYIVKLKGRLDTDTHRLCDEQMAALFGRAKGLILDLAELQYISSMGLRVLLKARKTMQQRDGSFLMTNVQPQIAKVLEIAEILPKEAIFTSVEEADRYLDHIQRKVIEEQPPAARPFRG